MGRNRGKVKRSAQTAIRQLQKSKYLETDDNNDYNNDIDKTDVYDDLSSDAETIIYEEQFIKRRNPNRKGDPMHRFDTKKNY